jgi:hypothetical protein
MKDEFPFRDPDPSGEDAPLSFRSDPGRPESTNSHWPRQRQVHHNAVTIRLIVMAALLLMVIWAMRTAGRADSWRWLFPDDRSGKMARDLAAGQPAAAGPSTASPVQIHSPPALPSAGESAEEDLSRFVEPAAVSDYEQEFVRRFLKSLDGPDAPTFWDVIRSVVEQRELAVGETAVAASLVDRFARQWEQWNLKWDSMFDEGSADPQLREGIMETRLRWESTILPALASVTIRPDPSLDQATIAEFRETVRRAADSLVEQYTAVGRPVESYAWFSAWEDVFDQPLALDRQALPAPSMTQLLGQPEAWTGKTISVEGTALRVQRVTAGNNPLGITGYYVIWVRPNQLSSYPFCVYSLLTPDGLTPAAGKTEREISEPIALAGRFFKVRLFDAAGQAAEAPLLMTSTVEVVPDPVSIRRDKPFRMPSPALIAATMATIGLLAAGIAWLAWRTSQSGKRRGALSGPRLESAISQLESDQRVETTREKLRRLKEGRHP